MAVTVVPERAPMAATVSPTTNWDWVDGLATDPNWVDELMSTVTVLPVLVCTVQVEPFSAVIWPRAP